MIDILYNFGKIFVQMTTVIQISDFRKNISGYIDQMIDSQGIIKIKKGKMVVARVLPEIKIKNEKQVNMAGNILDGLNSVRKKIKVKTKAKDEQELVNEIDRILYGIDRNGRELSA